MKDIRYYLQISFKVIIFTTLLSCSTGYNKPANQYYEEGLLFYERMEYDRSIESFDKVLELAPYGKDNNIVYYNRGMAYLKNRQYDKSIYDFTKAFELTSSGDKELRFDILSFRGEAYQKNNEFDHAIKDYSDAIALFPDHKNIKYLYAGRAWAWYIKKEYTSSIDDFSKAIAIDPEFDPAYYGRATVWFEKEDLQRALADAKEAAKFKPTNREYENLLFKIKSSMDQ
jgi:tetratricopeptide (TPR) repeat protein